MFEQASIAWHGLWELKSVGSGSSSSNTSTVIRHRREASQQLTSQISKQQRIEYKTSRPAKKERAQIEGQNQQEGRTIWDLEKQLDMWVGKYALCYVQQHMGCKVDTAHTLDKCRDGLQALVIQEVVVLEGIQFEQYGSCHHCGVAQQICMRWEERKDRQGPGCFQEAIGGQCQYSGIVRPAIAAIMIAGPYEVVEEGVYSPMRAEGIWGSRVKLRAEEEEPVKQRMIDWLGQRVGWASMEASVVMQVFDQLATALDQWKQCQTSGRPGHGEQEKEPSGPAIIAKTLRGVQESYEAMIQAMDQLQGQCIYCTLIYKGAMGERVAQGPGHGRELHSYNDCGDAAADGCGFGAYQQWREGVDFGQAKHCWECGLSQSICRRLEKPADQQVACEYPEIMLPSMFILHQRQHLHRLVEEVGFQGTYDSEDLWEWLNRTAEGFGRVWESNWTET